MSTPEGSVGVIEKVVFSGLLKGFIRPVGFAEMLFLKRLVAYFAFAKYSGLSMIFVVFGEPTPSSES